MPTSTSRQQSFPFDEVETDRERGAGRRLVGRPRKFDYSYRAKVIALVREGASIAKAARTFGISYQVAQSWAQRYKRGEIDEQGRPVIDRWDRVETYHREHRPADVAQRRYDDVVVYFGRPEYRQG